MIGDYLTEPSTTGHDWEIISTHQSRQDMIGKLFQHTASTWQDIIDNYTTVSSSTWQDIVNNSHPVKKISRRFARFHTKKITLFEGSPSPHVVAGLLQNRWQDTFDGCSFRTALLPRTQLAWDLKVAGYFPRRHASEKKRIYKCR